MNPKFSARVTLAASVLPDLRKHYAEAQPNEDCGVLVTPEVAAKMAVDYADAVIAEIDARMRKESL